VVEPPGIPPEHNPDPQQQTSDHREHNANEKVHEEGDEGEGGEDGDHDDDDDNIDDDPGDEEVVFGEDGANNEEEGGEEVEGGEGDESHQNQLMIVVHPIQPFPH